jgi:hypothetical protein
MGESLAWDALSLYLAEILRNFNFSVIPGKEPLEKEPISTGTLTPQRFSLNFSVIN